MSHDLIFTFYKRWCYCVVSKDRNIWLLQEKSQVKI